MEFILIVGGIITILLSGAGIWSTGNFVYYRYINNPTGLLLTDDRENATGVPFIIMETIARHSKYRDDKRAADKIRDSYIDVKEYRMLLETYNENGQSQTISRAVEQLKNIEKTHIAIAKRYKSTSAYSEDKRIVINDLTCIKARVTTIENELYIDVKTLKRAEAERDKLEQYAMEFQRIHEENVRKCDIIRLYNHRAKPLKELSVALMEIYTNIADKPDMGGAREEIKNQLTDLALEIDKTLEQVPSYDSVKYVENKLKVSRNLLQEIKNSEYVDVLQINKTEEA